MNRGDESLGKKELGRKLSPLYGIIREPESKAKGRQEFSQEYSRFPTFLPLCAEMRSTREPGSARINA